jgi:hypothetical protein
MSRNPVILNVVYRRQNPLDSAVGSGFHPAGNPSNAIVKAEVNGI